jgi:hypothetical protein
MTLDAFLAWQEIRLRRQLFAADHRQRQASRVATVPVSAVGLDRVARRLEFDAMRCRHNARRARERERRLRQREAMA